MKLVEVERKSKVLSKAQFGCLRDVYTLNITRGCEFRCVYCYARGYPEAPTSGEVHLYSELSEKLAGELDNPRRRSAVSLVAFNTASDSFQTHPEILDTTYRAMRVLLERGVGFSFLTKGWIPNRFIDLFSKFTGLVYARIGLVSVSKRYRELFEPQTATAAERFQNIDRLKNIGVDVEIRVDPIIPFYTDNDASIGRLYRALDSRDIRTVTLSYLHMRPAIMHQLNRELPATESQILRSCFKTQSWGVVGASTRSKLIPRPLREKGYGRFKALAKEFGITPVICACKNPGVSSHQCSIGLQSTGQVKKEGAGRQLSLFSC